jgi:hypothetical protein
MQIDDHSEIIAGTTVTVSGFGSEQAMNKVKLFVNRLRSGGSLVSLHTGPAFVSDAETAGYYAVFASGATVASDLLHPNRAYGQIAAMRVDLDRVFPDRKKIGEAAAQEMRWAGFGGPVPNPTASVTKVRQKKG